MFGPDVILEIPLSLTFVTTVTTIKFLSSLRLLDVTIQVGLSCFSLVSAFEDLTASANPIWGATIVPLVPSVRQLSLARRR